MKLDISKAGGGVERALTATTSPAHRAILENYRRHLMWEISGRYDLFLDDPAEMVAEPEYRFYGGMPGDGVLSGHDAVGEFYKGLVDTNTMVMYGENEIVTVFDWGFASDLLLHHFMPGQVMKALGEPVDDEQATYLLSLQTGMFWPYVDGRCAGEYVHQDWANRAVRKLAPEDVVTPEECAAVVFPLV